MERTSNGDHMPLISSLISLNANPCNPSIITLDRKICDRETKSQTEGQMPNRELNAELGLDAQQQTLSQVIYCRSQNSHPLMVAISLKSQTVATVNC